MNDNKSNQFSNGGNSKVNTPNNTFNPHTYQGSNSQNGSGMNASEKAHLQNINQRVAKDALNLASKAPAPLISGAAQTLNAVDNATNGAVTKAAGKELTNDVDKAKKALTKPNDLNQPGTYNPANLNNMVNPANSGVINRGQQPIAKTKNPSQDLVNKASNPNPLLNSVLDKAKGLVEKAANELPKDSLNSNSSTTSSIANHLKNSIMSKGKKGSKDKKDNPVQETKTKVKNAVISAIISFVVAIAPILIILLIAVVVVVSVESFFTSIFKIDADDNVSCARVNTCTVVMRESDYVPYNVMDYVSGVINYEYSDLLDSVSDEKEQIKIINSLSVIIHSEIILNYEYDQDLYNEICTILDDSEYLDILIPSTKDLETYEVYKKELEEYENMTDEEKAKNGEPYIDEDVKRRAHNWELISDNASTYKDQFIFIVTGSHFDDSILLNSSEYSNYEDLTRALFGFEEDDDDFHIYPICEYSDAYEDDDFYYVDGVAGAAGLEDVLVAIKKAGGFDYREKVNNGATEELWAHIDGYRSYAYPRQCVNVVSTLCYEYYGFASYGDGNTKAKRFYEAYADKGFAVLNSPNAGTIWSIGGEHYDGSVYGHTGLVVGTYCDTTCEEGDPGCVDAYDAVGNSLGYRTTDCSNDEKHMVYIHGNPGVYIEDKTVTEFINYYKKERKADYVQFVGKAAETTE